MEIMFSKKIQLETIIGRCLCDRLDSKILSISLQMLPQIQHNEVLPSIYILYSISLYSINHFTIY